MGEYQIIAMAAGMFFEFGIKDFIDILLVAFLLYYVYKLMKASGSIKVFTGILVFILIWLGDSGIGNEAFGFYFQYIDECGCVGLDCIVSG